LSQDTLRLMKSKGVFLVPTHLAAYWVGREAASYPPQIAAKARAAAAHHGSVIKAAPPIAVPIAYGADAGVYPHGLNALEFGLLTDLGMTPTAALLSATRDAARLLRIEAGGGTLHAGQA